MRPSIYYFLFFISVCLQMSAQIVQNPAASCNYAVGRTQTISAITIHDTEGSYAGTISWFQDCASQVSAHYVLRSSDGQVTQMVADANKAWHVGSENGYTIGLEHEGYCSQTGWYTSAMYSSSACLVKSLCNTYSINPTTTYSGASCTCSQSSASCLQSTKNIKGHQMFPNATHTDPGPNWNWANYYNLVNSSTCSSAASAPSNDDCNGFSQLYSNTSCSPTSGTVDNATADNFPNKATCDLATTSLGAGVFYKFTAAATTETITVTPTGTLDAVLVLYSGVCTNLQQVGCIDQSGGNGVVTTLVANGLTVGQIYTIRVYDYGSANASSGGFTICVTHTACTSPSTPSITGSNSICQGSTNTLGVTNYNAAYTYTWSTPYGTQTGATVAGNQTGTYTVAASNNCGTVSSTGFSVTVGQPPITPTVSPSGTTKVCLGDPATTFTVTNPCSGCNYIWSDAGNGISHSTSTNGSYYVFAQNSCGTSSNSNTVVLNVVSPPSVNASANPSSVVLGNASTLTASGASSYQWSNGLGSNNPVSTGSLNQNTTYTVTGTTNGCSATATVTVNVTTPTCASSTLTATNLNPAIVASTGGSGSSFVTLSNQTCNWTATSNDPSWLTVNPSSQQTGSGSLVWNATACNSSNNQRTGTITISGAQTQTITITQNCTNNCSNPPTANAGANKTYSAGVAIGGSPTASGGTGSYTYTWSPATGLSSTSIANPTVSGITATQTYTVIVTDGNGCTASSSVTVSVEPPPNCDSIYTIVQNPGTNKIKTLFDPSGATWRWTKDGVNTPDTIRYCIVTACADYRAYITINGKECPSKEGYFCPTGIEDISNLSFTISPNPNQGLFTITTDNRTIESIAIYDALGRLLISKKANTNNMLIDISDFTAGVYLIEVKNKEQRGIKKIEKY